MRIPKQKDQWLSKPVAILGWGVSGQSAAALVERMGGCVTVYDAEKGKAFFDEGIAREHELVVYSPAFAQDHQWLIAGRRSGCTVLAEMELALQCWQGAVVAITGTNGKTTLTDFLAKALQATGAKAVAAGNIGTPLGEFCTDAYDEESIAVLEVSSFQAEGLEQAKLHALLWTNFAEDHLDRYGSMKDYFLAKSKLVERLERDCLIVGESVVAAAAQYGFTLPAWTTVVSEKDTTGLIPSEGVFSHAPSAYNYLLARHFWEIEGFEIPLLESEAIKYELPEHRLTKIAEIQDISFWDDSKATNPHAALAALASFKQPVVWIGGGRDKGIDAQAFAQAVLRHTSKIVLMGESAQKLHDHFAKDGCKPLITATMEEAVEAAFALAKPSEAVLLSPGYASFGLFADYKERGKVFEKAVLSLKQLNK